MPLTPNFSTSQQAGLPSNVIITDTSTGSDYKLHAVAACANFYLNRLPYAGHSFNRHRKLG